MAKCAHCGSTNCSTTRATEEEVLRTYGLRKGTPEANKLVADWAEPGFRCIDCGWWHDDAAAVAEIVADMLADREYMWQVALAYLQEED